MTTVQIMIRPLTAHAGLYRHHCGQAPYADQRGTIRESYQALNAAGEAVATLSMTDGELDRPVLVAVPILHQVALQSWAAQIGEDYHRRAAEIAGRKKQERKA